MKVNELAVPLGSTSFSPNLIDREKGELIKNHSISVFEHSRNHANANQLPVTVRIIDGARDTHMLGLKHSLS